MRVVGCPFREFALWTERSVNFVGRNMQESEPIASMGRQRPPILETGLQQVVGSDHVGLNELARPIDAAVHMTFRRQVHDGIGSVVSDRAIDRTGVSNVDPSKLVAWMIGNVGQRIQIPGIGQRVNIEHLMTLSQGHANEIGADETGTASDQDAEWGVGSRQGSWEFSVSSGQVG